MIELIYKTYTGEDKLHAVLTYNNGQWYMKTMYFRYNIAEFLEKLSFLRRT